MHANHPRTRLFQPQGSRSRPTPLPEQLGAKLPSSCCQRDSKARSVCISWRRVSHSVSNLGQMLCEVVKFLVCGCSDRTMPPKERRNQTHFPRSPAQSYPRVCRGRGGFRPQPTSHLFFLEAFFLRMLSSIQFISQSTNQLTTWERFP
jgi:hypothetical protein